MGIRAPTALNFWGDLRNSTTSCSSSLASSTPATSEKCMLGWSAVIRRARLLLKEKMFPLPGCELPCLINIIIISPMNSNGNSQKRDPNHPMSDCPLTCKSILDNCSSVTP